MEWVRAFLAITLSVIALQPARAAAGIARDLHTTEWPQSLTRWALENRLYLVAFDGVTIYVYAVLGVTTLVVAFLQRTGRLASLSPRTRRILGCVQCPKMACASRPLPSFGTHLAAAHVPGHWSARVDLHTCSREPTEAGQGFREIHDVRTRAAPFAELLIDAEEDRTLRAVLVGMLRETERRRDR